MTIPPQISLSAKAADRAAFAVRHYLDYLRGALVDLAEIDEDARSDLEMDVTYYEGLLRQLGGK